MAATLFRSEERIALVVAVAAHAAMLALLVMRPSYAPVFQPPQRIEVTLSDNAGLTSTSPEPKADAMADVAPDIGDVLPEETKPEPPKPEPLASPSPQPIPRPVASAAPKPKQVPPPKPSSAPARAATKSATKTPTKPDTRIGGSRIGSDFLEGVHGAQSTGASRNPPAQVAGPAVKASLLGAISRALKPHWQGKVPDGPDSEKLVTILRWNLNQDGTLSGPVEFVSQEGRTDANRSQWDRHKEQAIRAVQLAAPFNLPAEYYDTWKRVGPIRFDKRLSQ